MANRALLLCGDEKAVLAITQILDELEISFEHSSEPPFALKRLANRHFDLLIVDCDNVQNATQVFNSARSSNLNKASIAIAIVEGKAGVPIAFRLGASLVLTKPVSLEQARNTLRTGVGMTRKDAPEAKAPASVVPATPSVPAASTPAPVMPTPAAPTPAAPALTPQSPASTPVEKAPITATATAFSPAAASAPIAPKAPDIVSKTKEAEAPKIEKPIPAPAPVNAKPVPARPVPVDSKSTDEYKPALTNFTDEEPATSHPAPGLAKAAAASGKATVETSKFDSVFAGPVPAAGAEKTKIGSAKSATSEDASKKDEKTAPILRIEDPLADDDSVLDPIRDNGVPSFGTMSHQSFAGLETQGSKEKGMLVAGLVLLLFGAGGYAAWLTQPAFRDILTFEYHEIVGKIAEWRGHPQVKEVAAAAKPLPIPPAPPAPTPVPEPSQQIASTTPEDPSALQSPTAGTTTDVNSSLNLPSANANSSPTPSESPAQVSKATTASTPQKGASLQSAKQDTTAGHASATPAVVPAAANVPPSTAKKSSANDLIEVPEDFADDQIVHRVHPTYPKQARAKKLHGTVVLQAVVNKQGKVDSLQLVSGDAQLAQAAAEAVKQWRYKPYSRNGEPVDFQTRVTVDFKMP
jgi:TonB family protein